LIREYLTHDYKENQGRGTLKNKMEEIMCEKKLKKLGRRKPVETIRLTKKKKHRQCLSLWILAWGCAFWPPTGNESSDYASVGVSQSTW
jgi:hypothetical protein